MAEQPLTIYEILREAAGKKKIEERAKVLQNHSSTALKTVLGYALDPRVMWLIPEGVPPYISNRDRKSSVRFSQLTKKLHYFVDGQDPIRDRLKRERLFINMLEDVDDKDALVLLAIKEKKLPFEQLTREVVDMAFPKLTKDWPKEKPVEDDGQEL
ncbi:MAG TPA: DUF6433 family protein [bacterium]